MLVKYRYFIEKGSETYKNNGLKLLSLITISTELSTVLHNFDYIFQCIDMLLRTKEKTAHKGGYTLIICRFT